MVVTKQHIAWGTAITVLLGIILLGIYLYQRNRSKTVIDIKTKVDINTKPATGAGSFITNDFYGTQKVYRDPAGVWRILPGVCTITETGIVDWDKIKEMPQIEKDKLYADLDKCKLNNLPLIQPA